MGIATLRARAKDNRSLITRFFASFVLLIVAASGIAVSLAPQTASAAEEWSWINEARIEAKGLTNDKGVVIKDTNGNVRTFVFLDTQPYDTNRTFKELSSGPYCKNDVRNTLTMHTPGSGTFTRITTEVPLDWIYNKDIRVTCETETSSVSVGNLENGRKESRPCNYTGSQAEERCAEERKNGNAEWIRRCGYLDSPGAPSTTVPGSLCANDDTTTNPPGTGGSGEDTSKKEIDECDGLGEFSMRWIACPILTASLKTVGLIDGLLEEYLHYDTEIFDRSSDKGKNFYEAWSTFRGIALALVLLAGLVMVVSQGTGMQIFDAYTVKKVMPRLLIAVIGITLSWPILQFVITFFNDLGHWTQDIILMPFQEAAKSTGNKGIAEGFGGAAFIITAFTGTTVYAIALGPLGVLSLLGTVMIALLIGLIVMLIRSVVITVAIIFAPLAIACYILPNTKKVWDFWQNALVTALTIFPIIMALLAAGKALALVTDSGLMKVLFVIAPYFFLPFAFKLAGGLMSTIFSLTNDRGRGAFDRLRNMRQEQIKQRGERWRDGRLFKQKGMFDKAGLNSAGLAAGAFARAENKTDLLPGITKNPFRKKNWGALGSAMTTQQRIAAMKQQGRDEHKVTQFDDDQQRAQMFGSEQEARTGLKRFFNYNPEQIEKAIDAAKANGGFSKAIQLKAYEASAASGTVFKDWDDALSLGQHISGDNEQFRGQAAAHLKQQSVRAGRVMYGASIGDIYSAMGDVNEKAKVGQRSRFLDGQELTVKAALAQDATTVLRGKTGDMEKISKAITAELKDQNTIALTASSPEEARAAEGKLANLSVAINGFAQNTQYASMDNTVAFRDNMEVPTREVRENVKRAAQAEVESRRPMRDSNGQQMFDTAGNRLYEVVTHEVERTVQTPQGPTIVRRTEPKRETSQPNFDTGEFGYRNDPRDTNNITNTYRDLTDLKQPYGDPRDRRNIANQQMEKDD